MLMLYELQAVVVVGEGCGNVCQSYNTKQLSGFIEAGSN